MTAPKARYIILTVFVWLLGSVSAALAGDIASFRAIGFSEDGKVFAFEEYGIQDGSGFPYSNIFAIDTEKDSFIAGTPIRVRLDDEMAGLGKARAEASDKAAAVLSQYRLEDRPGQLVAFNPVSEGTGNARVLRYYAYPAEPAFGGLYGLKLEEIAEEPSPACKELLAKVRSFRLVLTAVDGKPTNKTVYKDDGIPQSRNCPGSYRLGGVVTYQPAGGGETLHIALVTVLSFGFEGRDGRWIAIPVRP